MNMARTATSFALLALSVSPAAGYWLMPCWPITTQRLDPIVNPGEISGHVHQIVGGGAFAPAMTYADTQNSDCTTCFVSKDKSNYWIPQLYAQLADGSFELVPQDGSTSVYYFNEKVRLGPGETMEPMPKGLRMLAGNPFKRSGGTDFASQAINYHCLDYAGSPTQSKNFPNQNCPDGLRAEVTFPSCWDGENLDSADHKSHMAYPTETFESGACPKSHPHHVLTMKVEFIFQTEKYASLITADSQPFRWSPGDGTGYGLHADYVMGWDYDVLESATNNCFDINGVLTNCPAFDGLLPPGGQQYANPGTCTVKTYVDEDIGGTVSALPGCNPITFGPAAASEQKCQSDPAKLLGDWAWAVANSTNAGAAISSAAGQLLPSSSTSSSASESASGAGFYAQQDSSASSGSSVVTSSAAVVAAAATPTTSSSEEGPVVVTVTEIETAYTTVMAAVTVAVPGASPPAKRSHLEKHRHPARQHHGLK